MNVNASMGAMPIIKIIRDFLLLKISWMKMGLLTFSVKVNPRSGSSFGKQFKMVSVGGGQNSRKAVGVGGYPRVIDEIVVYLG